MKAQQIKREQVSKEQEVEKKTFNKMSAVESRH